jgi:RimJ/RimL family protein N-acetyltransferase
LNTEWYYQLQIEDLRQLSVETEPFLRAKGWSSSPEGTLSPEFLAAFLPRAEAMPAWLGFLALRDNEVIGSGGYRAAPCDGFVEIGYGISPSFQGQGCATRLTARMVEYAFSQPDAHIIRAHTLVDGIASQTVLLKNQFEFVGVVQDPEDGTVHRYERLK